jgi:hypothetical protein
MIKEAMETCRHVTAEALNIEKSRVSASADEGEEGDIIVSVLVDGKPITSAQRTQIEEFVRHVDNQSKN